MNLLVRGLSKKLVKQKEENSMTQKIEVEYNSDMVEKDLQAQSQNDQTSLIQDGLNEDTIEDMIDEGCVVDDNQE